VDVKLKCKVKRIVIFICAISLYSTWSWGQTWNLSETMTATLNDGVLTIETTMDSEEMPNYQGLRTPPWRRNSNNIFMIIINEGVSNIGDWAFGYLRNLQHVIIPGSATTLGYGAFGYCPNLHWVAIENPTLQIIGERAFTNCVNFLGILSGTTIDTNAYEDSIITIYNTVIPNSVTTIGANAFEANKSLTFITIPNSVTTIGSQAFSYCTNLTSIILPNSIHTIEWGTFSGCKNLTSIDIPNSVTSIGLNTFDFKARGAIGTSHEGAFQRCISLTSITIPNSVTMLGFETFKDCTGLTSINISNSVNNVGGSLFSGCTALKDIIINWSEPLPSSRRLGVNAVFYRFKPANATLHVPGGTEDLYKANQFWKGFKIVAKETKNEI